MDKFAQTLRHWRSLRRFSQLELAMEADVSSRHISFLETGRAKPSRDMISRLCQTLELPLSAANQMMLAAGFAPRYSQKTWDDEAMIPVRAAIDLMLQNHQPYPAFAIDRMWTVFKLNGPAERLFSAVGLQEGASMLDLISGNLLAQVIENWPEVAHHSARRLRTESAAMGGVAAFDEAARKLSKTKAPEASVSAAVVPTVFRLGEMRLSLFSTIAQFGTPEDLALDDMKIELFFPSDEASANLLKAFG